MEAVWGRARGKAWRILDDTPDDPMFRGGPVAVWRHLTVLHLVEVLLDDGRVNGCVRLTHAHLELSARLLALTASLARGQLVARHPLRFGDRPLKAPIVAVEHEAPRVVMAVAQPGGDRRRSSSGVTWGLPSRFCLGCLRLNKLLPNGSVRATTLWQKKGEGTPDACSFTL